ncbi:uncharacterized protein LOC106161022 [Lingula anatina]|uniref:Uncharacterized protein LOC106161022 n=1 Tax=Lingula anatina TaxID=7574 RepID=A0A1S3I505_LINAN|nr:uncharacterized protein LOC106161022 [Lingula anatina]|eukprot:XP_013393303.1 uncharacterized protein LOC106161022 [Lingula anatina]
MPNNTASVEDIAVHINDAVNSSNSSLTNTANANNFPDGLPLINCMILFIVIVVGLPENVCVILTIAKKRSFRTSINTLVAYTSLMDVLQCLFGATLHMRQNILGQRGLSQWECYTLSFVSVFTNITNVCLLGAISVLRLIQFFAKQNNQPNRVLIFISIVVSTTVGLTLATAATFYSKASYYICTNDDRQYLPGTEEVINYTLFLPVFGLSAILIVVSYLGIYCRVRKYARVSPTDHQVMTTVENHDDHRGTQIKSVTQPQALPREVQDQSGGEPQRNGHEQQGADPAISQDIHKWGHRTELQGIHQGVEPASLQDIHQGAHPTGLQDIHQGTDQNLPQREQVPDIQQIPHQRNDVLAARTFALVLFVWLLLYLPLPVIGAWKFRHGMTPQLKHIRSFFASLNCMSAVLNPLIYWYGSKKFRKAISCVCRC